MSNIAVESWAWYGLTWLVVMTRMVSQILLRGSLKRLNLDDYLMAVIMATDTILVVVINIISNTNSNLIDPSQPIFLSLQDIREREYGSKMVLLGEQMQCITIWLTKGCLLLIFKDPFSPEWMFWYIRESSTAIIVANLPLTWTVFRRLFNLGSFNHSEYSFKVRSAKLSTVSGSHITYSRNQNRNYKNQEDANGGNANGSEENIGQSYGISLKIYQRHDVQISSERAHFDTLTDGITTTTVIQGGQPRSFSHAEDIAAADRSTADRSCPVVNAMQGV
ncbi:hypothetical protein E4U53_003026 [Claviceps sorghi]|nr:hypothetical protein E4U53_003026 [Claviceps sorghi]